MYQSIILPIFRALESVLDAILPLRARSARTKRRTIDDIPLMPTPYDLLGVRITTLMDYQNRAVQDLIRSLKYDGSAHAATLAASLLADYLQEEIATQRQFSARKILIAPVPLHKSRRHERGFNQIALVLEQLPKEFRNGTLSTLASDVLARSRPTRPQTKLPRSERLTNVKGAFEVNEVTSHSISETHIFLIDDVTTTGATLKYASIPLKAAGATVTLLALARA